MGASVGARVRTIRAPRRRQLTRRSVHRHFHRKPGLRPPLCLARTASSVESVLSTRRCLERSDHAKGSTGTEVPSNRRLLRPSNAESGEMSLIPVLPLRSRSFKCAEPDQFVGLGTGGRRRGTSVARSALSNSLFERPERQQVRQMLNAGQIRDAPTTGIEFGDRRELRRTEIRLKRNAAPRRRRRSFPNCPLVIHLWRRNRNLHSIANNR